MEIRLTHPVEVDGNTYAELSVASVDAIAAFRSNSPEQVILSMARVFGVPRRVVRHLHPDDARKAGDLIVSLLDIATCSLTRIA